LDLEDTSLQPAAAAAAAAQGGGTSNPQQQQQQSEALQQYSRRRQEVLDLIPTVFADADEQYASLAAVKAKLEGFKAQYPKEYATAYIGESAAALFAPFVRLELLQWEPLPLLQQQQQQQGGSGSSSSGLAAADGQSPGFDTQDWYQQLFEYGLAAAAGPAAAAAEDADANLVPQLVESLVLPLALSLVAR
jgi:GC-rich sequence DNA-binding factor